jgi:hypothetical protein
MCTYEVYGRQMVIDFWPVLLKNVIISIEQGKRVSFECGGFVIKSLLPNMNLRLVWIKDYIHVIINRSLDLNSIREYDAHAIDIFFIKKVNQNHSGIYECQIQDMDNLNNFWIVSRVKLKVMGFTHIYKSKTFILYQNIFIIIILVVIFGSLIFNLYLSWNNLNFTFEKFIEMTNHLKSIESN